MNPASDVDQYPLPKLEDLFTSLAGGKTFTKLDLSNKVCSMQIHKP